MQFLIERARESLDALLARILSHQADAPDLAGQGAEARADLDAVRVEQAPPKPRLAALEAEDRIGQA